jgi:hypothetical protein
MPNGKGSGRRPAAVGDSHIDSEWERIFGSGGAFGRPAGGGFPPRECPRCTQAAYPTRCLHCGWTALECPGDPRPLQRPAQTLPIALEGKGQ